MSTPSLEMRCLDPAEGLCPETAVATAWQSAMTLGALQVWGLVLVAAWPPEPLRAAYMKFVEELRKNPSMDSGLLHKLPAHRRILLHIKAVV